MDFGGKEVDVSEETEPVQKPEPKPDPALKPRPANTVVLKRGDTPSSVARDIYGTVGAARELAIKNRPSKWREGDIIKLL